GGDVQRDDAIELVGHALAEFGLRGAAVQRQFLLPRRRLAPAVGQLFAKAGFAAAAGIGIGFARDAPALPRLAAAAEEDDRAEQQRQRDRNADPQQHGVRHRFASVDSSYAAPARRAASARST